MSDSTQVLKFDQAAAELLEEPTMRVPYELMRRNHRAAQRQLEKDFGFLQSAIKSARSLGNEPDARPVIIESLSTCTARTTALKRKLTSLQPSSSSPAPLKSRLPILTTISTLSSSSHTITSPTWRTFSQSRLDRYIIEYLLRTGRTHTAEVYARERKVEGEVDMRLFGECARVERALVEGRSCTEALAWCGENRGTLKKTKNNLEFSLRLQEYIELCRARKPEPALAYFKKFLAPWSETHMGMIERAIALLAFGEGCGVAAYKALYATSRWEELATEFRQTFNGIYGIPSHSLLSLTMAAGIASLKLAACLPTAPHVDTNVSAPSDATMSDAAMTLPIPSLAASPPIHMPAPGPTSDPAIPLSSDPTPLHNHPEHGQRNVDCPTCGSDMAVLAKGIPFSHHTNSKLVCRITGEVMDDENPPLAFPNGYVYSRKAMLDMSGDNPKALVTCPRTGETCQYSKLRKVFVS